MVTTTASTTGIVGTSSTSASVNTRPPSRSRKRQRDLTPKERTLAPAAHYAADIATLNEVRSILMNSAQRDVTIRRGRSGRINAHVVPSDPASVDAAMELLKDKVNLRVVLRRGGLCIYHGETTLALNASASRHDRQRAKYQIDYLRHDLGVAQESKKRVEQSIAVQQDRLDKAIATTKIRLQVQHTTLADACDLARALPSVLAVAEPGAIVPSLDRPVPTNSIGILFMPVMYTAPTGALVPATPMWFNISEREPCLRTLKTKTGFPSAHPHAGIGGSLCMGNAQDTLMNLITAGNFKALLWFVSAYRLGWNLSSEVDRNWTQTSWGLWKRCREGDNPWKSLWDGETYQDAMSGAFRPWKEWLPPEFADLDNMPYLMHVTTHLRGGVQPTLFEMRDNLRATVPLCLWCGGSKLVCPCHSSTCEACNATPCACTISVGVLDQLVDRRAGEWIEIKPVLRAYLGNWWCGVCATACSWIRRPTQKTVHIRDLMGNAEGRCTRHLPHDIRKELGFV